MGRLQASDITLLVRHMLGLIAVSSTEFFCCRHVLACRTDTPALSLKLVMGGSSDVSMLSDPVGGVAVVPFGRAKLTSACM